MAIVKSKLLNQLKESFPNIYIKDLERIVSIILNEIKNTLKRGERVEIRSSLGIFYTKIQKPRISRNPRTGEKVNTEKKNVIMFKMSRELFKKLNNDK